MRKKLEKEEKRPTISISINNDLNNLIEEEMVSTSKKKSQIIEKAIKIFIENNGKDNK